jgi:hypothetical protein
MNECPGCGGPLAGDEETCPACGAAIAGTGPGEDGPPVAAAPARNGEKTCPACGAFNPATARYCVRCRHSFDGETTIFGFHYAVVPLAILVVLAVVAAMAFPGFAADTGSGTTTVSPQNTSAQSGASEAARAAALNRTQTPTPNATALPNASLNASPTRTVDPNATIWNAQIGAGIYHTDGGTHYVGPSDELAQRIREAGATPTPVSPLGYGSGSGHATGPYSWVGTGNWSPGFIDLPVGDVQVVLLSQGTSAFVIADPAGNEVGFGAFPPPGGTFAVPIPAAGRYVIGFGAANATDSWSATLMLPGSGQSVTPPVPTPNTQVFSFAGTGAGTAGSFNLMPGTAHVQLYASSMTMAYLKDEWGVTISTTVAGPYAGGSTAAITRAGRYRLETWGTDAWSAVVTWTGNPGTGGPTLPTVDPAQVKPTLTPWNWTANATANASATPPA